MLLDTQIVIWSVARPERLGPTVMSELSDRRHDVFFSAASVWEVAIKFALGRPDFQTPPDQLASDANAAGFAELPITAKLVARAAALPHHHRDPFDRLLVAQATEESAVLLTADRTLLAYGPAVRLAN